MSDNISTDNLPTYSWYKDNDIATINGIFTSTMTAISKDNFTSSELANQPALSNFNLTSKKNNIIWINTFKNKCYNRSRQRNKRYINPKLKCINRI